MVFLVLILLRPLQGTCMWLHPGVLIYTCVQSDGSFGELTALPSPRLRQPMYPHVDNTQPRIQAAAS